MGTRTAPDDTEVDGVPWVADALLATGTTLAVALVVAFVPQTVEPAAYGLALACGALVLLGRRARHLRTRHLRTRHGPPGDAATEVNPDHHLQSERLRIAADLHDVIAHNLSLAALHTQIATEAVGRNEDAARTALRHVDEATAATLHELRATVRVLRDAPAVVGHRDTLPAATGPAGLAALVEPARARGLTVTTRVDVPARSLDATIDAAAYRIVQESLANVLLHSGAERAVVRLAVADGRLRITVHDDGRGAAGRTNGAGIAAMHERATLLGGHLSAHDAPDGGFAVVADLPARLVVST